MLREAVRGPERLAAYATAEGYPMSAEDIVTALWGTAHPGRHDGMGRDVEHDLAEDETERDAQAWFGIRNPMLDLFRWYRGTIA